MPFGFTLWQLSLINNFERVALYRKVRALKFVSFCAALGLGIKEKLNLEYQWQYFDRFYPEPTELQKTFVRDALAFKESQYNAPSEEEITKMDLDKAKIYE